MPKRRIKHRRTGGGERGGQSGMLRQLQSMQEDMLKAQEEIAATTVTTSAGGGAVTAVISGAHRVQSITVAREVVDPEDVEMLQDLIVAAINDGLQQIDQRAEERMSSLTGGLNVPDLL